MSMNLVVHHPNPHQFLMAPNSRNFQPIKTQADSIHQPAFPILAVALLSIIGTAFLLASYYIFVVKCCSNWHQFNLFRRFSILRSRQDDHDSFIALSPTTTWNRGLDESVICEIPTFQFKGVGEMEGERSVFGCVVCLNEFQVQDTLRLLPNCNHAFHLDCIDIWLQGNGNCPLCRTSIAGTILRCPIDPIVAPSSSPQELRVYSDSLMGSDKDFVVIELGGEDGEEVVFPQTQQEERNSSREVLASRSSDHSPKKMVEKGRVKKCHHVSIIGDECIDVRDVHKDDHFCIQPIRRSFSWDSANDRQLYSTVREILQKSRRPLGVVSTNGECDGRIRNRSSPFDKAEVPGMQLFLLRCNFKKMHIS